MSFDFNQARIQTLVVCFIFWLGICFLYVPRMAVAGQGGESPLTMEWIHKTSAQTDIKNQSDRDIRVSVTGFKLKQQLNLGEVKLPFIWSLQYRHTDLIEDSDTEIPSHLEERRAGVGTRFPMPWVDRDDLFMGVDVFPTFNTDSGRWRSGAFRIPLRIYGIYKESDDFILVAGVWVRPDYDDMVLPLAGIRLRLDERWLLDLLNDHPRLSFAIDDQWELFWELDYQWEEFEVTHNGVAGRILKHHALGLGMGVGYHGTNGLTASISVGSDVYRRLEYEDDLGKIHAEPAVYGQVRFSKQF